jgi:phage gpG-like protein
MPFRMTFEVFGDKVVARKLLRFGERALDMSPAWDDVTKEFQRAFERNFAQQGPGWAPLKPSTVRSRIAQGYSPGPILTKSGAYRRAMTSGLQTHRSADELIALAPTVPGQFHQHGTKTPMPARPLRLKETEKRNIMKILQRALIEGYEEG